MGMLNILAGITALFFVFLIAKSIFKGAMNRLCVICASISITWIVLLVLIWVGIFKDRIMAAILIGMSITGAFYYLEKKVNEEMKLFRLPFMLTLISLVYYTLQPSGIAVSSIIFLAIIWILFYLTYLYRNNPGMNRFVKKLLECCKTW